VESDGLASDLQKGRISRAVADGLPQPVERLGQIVPGLGLGLVGPEQAGEGLAAVRGVGVHGQVGEQGARRVGPKAGDRLPVQRDLERAQKRDGETRHSTPRRYR